MPHSVTGKVSIITGSMISIRLALTQSLPAQTFELELKSPLASTKAFKPVNSDITIQ